jgi:hypothetical protein
VKLTPLGIKFLKEFGPTCKLFVQRHKHLGLGRSRIILKALPDKVTNILVTLIGLNKNKMVLSYPNRSHSGPAQ